MQKRKNQNKVSLSYKANKSDSHLLLTPPDRYDPARFLTRSAIFYLVFALCCWFCVEREGKEFVAVEVARMMFGTTFSRNYDFCLGTFTDSIINYFFPVARTASVETVSFLSSIGFSGTLAPLARSESQFARRRRLSITTQWMSLRTRDTTGSCSSFCF